jgi:hypothetical protein
MFQISPDQIARLDDSQLRTLVGMLCEAELHLEGLSSTHVTWGGSQTAADGGIDVRVSLPPDSKKRAGYVSRPCTGFQVKCEDMPRGEIATEMAPGGVLRPTIVELIAASGSYVIVSSQGSISDKPLKARRAAMRDQVASADPAHKLHTDFYDRQRLASWVAEHPALVIWVRHTIGEPVRGWQPYGAWSRGALDLDDPYVVDDSSRLVDLRRGQATQLSVSKGIAEMRDVLNRPGGVVRLVGLSGLGKTRLAQALFDERVEPGHTPSARFVHYTDHAHDPNPGPLDCINRLEAARRRGILVVDNCPPSVHEQLALRCSQCNHVSLISIEYDVRDESIEGADVFLLEPASNDAIIHVLRSRFPLMDSASLHRISDVAGGNVRLALEIAASVRHGESLIGVKSADLFQRLFHRRERASDDLMSAAEVCSLTVSFDVDGSADDHSELETLARLSGHSSLKLYGLVGELRDRRLVQARSQWRAVLPQALAGWLAGRALKRIPVASIRTELFDNASQRIRLSFARRVGDLHEEPEAIKLVQQWFSRDGSLGDPFSLPEEDRRIFTTVAPVAPQLALDAIERSLAGPAGQTVTKYTVRPWLALLAALAYDDDLFDRAAGYMAALVTNCDLSEDSCEILADLFQVILSSTQATPARRRAFVSKTIASSDERTQRLGLKLLRALLKIECRAQSFPHFGSRRRTFGYWPAEKGELDDWYDGAVALTAEAAATSAVREPARDLLAKSFRGLWIRRVNNRKSLIEAATRVSSCGSWFAGWIAVRNTLRSRKLGADSTGVAQLEELERVLRPGDSLALLFAYLNSERHGALDIAGDLDTFGVEGHQDAQSATDAQATALSEEVVAAGMGASLFPAVVCRGKSWTDSIARGIYRGCIDKAATWNELLNAYSSTDASQRSHAGLSAFLAECGRCEPVLCDELLDRAIEDSRLGNEFPQLQIWGPATSAHAADRLLRSIELGRSASAFAYAWRVPMPESTFAALQLRIAELPLGSAVAIENLCMRTHDERRTPAGVAQELLECGRSLLLSCTFETEYDSPDRLIYEISELIRMCLSGESAAPVARAFVARLTSKIERYGTVSHLVSEIIPPLIEIQPLPVLDGFFDEDGESAIGLRADEPHMRDALRLLDRVNVEALEQWVLQKPSTRATRIVPYITCVSTSESSAAWSDSFMRVMAHAPSLVACYRAIEPQLLPVWYREQSEEVVSKTRLLVEELVHHIDADVSAWAKDMLVRMTDAVAEERARRSQRTGGFE